MGKLRQGRGSEWWDAVNGVARGGVDHPHGPEINPLPVHEHLARRGREVAQVRQVGAQLRHGQVEHAVLHLGEEGALVQAAAIAVEPGARPVFAARPGRRRRRRRGRRFNRPQVRREHLVAYVVDIWRRRRRPMGALQAALLDLQQVDERVHPERPGLLLVAARGGGGGGARGHVECHRVREQRRALQFEEPARVQEPG